MECLYPYIDMWASMKFWPKQAPCLEDVAWLEDAQFISWFSIYLSFFPRAASRRSQFYRQMYEKLRKDLVDLACEYSRLSFAPATTCETLRQTSAIQGQKFHTDDVNLPALKWHNRPFARPDHMVRNKLHWGANYAVELPKQRNSYQSSPTFLCFESPNA